MEKSIVKKSVSERTFEDIKKVDENGNEYWFAREMQVVLNYAKWDNLLRAIKDAKISCGNSGYRIEDHFADVSKMVKLGSGSSREIKDLKLSRYACYLIAQNGDPRKEVIALAQTYFAVKTREKELDEKRKEELIRIEAREELTHAEKKFSDTLWKRGVDGRGIGVVRAKGDKTLFGGFTTKDMKLKLQINEKEPLADYLPTVTIGAKIFATGMTMHNAEEKDLQGKHTLTQEHVDSNRVVRTALIKRGIKPEELPKGENVKKLKRKHEDLIPHQEKKEISF